MRQIVAPYKLFSSLRMSLYSIDIYANFMLYVDKISRKIKTDEIFLRICAAKN
jgi:hypothetical protein